MSVTVTSIRCVFSSASSTEKRSGNWVNPLPHSTPPLIADPTALTETSVARFAVLLRLITAIATCEATTNTKKIATKETAVMAIMRSTLEPEGSSVDRGSTATVFPNRRL